ncbi:hypothetical protein LUZ62_020813 [Rhynchospora pubera]|uniref:NAC domain-containing protein n=2 Tax=Rhynchospora pubera TaxID=906938 RepID=A0AAV8H0M3_9POAL|nr:hypothetical protein LUZ62_020813 [Rhynchospora pubera]
MQCRFSMEMMGRQFESCDGQLPPGYRFHPTDEELITYYLVRKVRDGNFTSRAIADIDLNKCEPWELPEKATMGEKEWYFFSLRDRKYPTGLRTNRATQAGYWKATGKDREIFIAKTGTLVGMKKTLVFYKGRAPKGEKSNWVMHEYRLEGMFAYHYLSASSKDEWVVTRVFQKIGPNCKKPRIPITNGAAAVSFSDSASGASAAAAGCHSSATSAASLPPILDPNFTDRGSCSYSAASQRELVPCFSTASGDINAASPIAASGHYFPLPIEPPPLPVGLQNPSSYFPSLRTLQENLQFPIFFSNALPVSASVWPVDVDRKFEMNTGRANLGAAAGSTELDCVWTF